MGDTVTYP